MPLKGAIGKEDALSLSRIALIEVLLCKRAEIENKRAETLGALDDQIAGLRLAAVPSMGAGARSPIAEPRLTLGKLVDVRADAAKRFEDAMQELVRQEQSWLGDLMNN